MGALLHLQGCQEGDKTAGGGSEVKKARSPIAWGPSGAGAGAAAGAGVTAAATTRADERNQE